MPGVEVIIPWQPGDPAREAALRWVCSRYVTEQPTFKVTIAEAEAGAPWCKARAANPAVERSTADLVVLADADVWTDGLPAAITAVQDGAGWAIPHFLVHRLDPEGTARVLAGAPAHSQCTCEEPYRGVRGGGALVARRSDLLQAPLDTRFVGWGQEDVSHALALDALAGKAWRGTADLWHLWHEPQHRAERSYGSIAGTRLHRRYIAAWRDPNAMRALIQEVNQCPSPTC